MSLIGDAMAHAILLVRSDFLEGPHVRTVFV
jgi:hypothetical protein